MQKGPTMLDTDSITIGLKELGVVSGDKILVHSSMAAIGDVDGGADTVIDALINAVGPDGMIVVPTFACVAPYDRRTSKTPLGAVSDRLWRRPGAVRSLHPTHSVAAIGKGAEELVKDHEKAPTAYAEGTPYYKLTQMGGKILLLGVDQDRNTTMHAVESIAHSPYLKDIQGTYIDDELQQITIPIADMAGPHRDFIGLDRLFRDRNIMRIGRIGGAVCRLIEAGPMLQVSLEAFQKDPAAVLCENPECKDCVMQRGLIKKARLKNEDFILAARASDISEHWDEILAAIRGEGIDALELSATEYLRFGKQIEEEKIKVVSICASATDAIGVAAARRLGVPLTMLVSSKEGFNVACETQASGVKTLMINAGMPSSFYAGLYGDNLDVPGFGFSPSQFAVAGEKAFLQVFYKGTLRKHTEFFYVDDGTFSGHPTLPGKGNGEVKEIISMLRCRSFAGPMVLRSHTAGVTGFRKTAAAFWDLLDNM
jgi:aminoglycoside 3-N-acetyltransferase